MQVSVKKPPQIPLRMHWIGHKIALWSRFQSEQCPYLVCQVFSTAGEKMHSVALQNRNELCWQRENHAKQCEVCLCPRASPACSARASPHESVIWDRVRALILSRKTGEGVFCLRQIFVQNRGKFLWRRVRFSRGRERVAHPGLQGQEAARSWCWITTVPLNLFAFILTISHLPCVIPMVRSSLFLRAAGWLEQGSLSYHQRLLSAGSTTLGRWVLPVAFSEWCKPCQAKILQRGW